MLLKLLQFLLYEGSFVLALVIMVFIYNLFEKYSRVKVKK